MKSMTGFGKFTYDVNEYQIDIEVKSINHRYLDFQFRLPREYSSLEMPLRQTIKEEVQRGRVETVISINVDRGSKKQLSINWQLLDSLVHQLNKAKIERYKNADIDTNQIMAGLVNQPDFFEVTEGMGQDENIEAHVVKGMQEVLLRLNNSRAVEGTHIRTLLEEYLSKFTTYLVEVSEATVLFEQDYQNKLEDKMINLLGETIDKSRLLTEVAILIERGDIHEELDRLSIHVKKMTSLLGSENPVGRELDFLIQEMNREVNTIGSKSSPIQIKEAVVQMKTILEKIREQVQNVE